jgi:membrane-bound metal-dependent hydrolase YbcI (DUF457 family)
MYLFGVFLHTVLKIFTLGVAWIFWEWKRTFCRSNIKQVIRKKEKKNNIKILDSLKI